MPSYCIVKAQAFIESLGLHVQCKNCSHKTALQRSEAMQIWNKNDVPAVFRKPPLCATELFCLPAEWHRIEPEQGRIDQDAVAHYHKIFDCIRKWDPAHPPSLPLFTWKLEHPVPCVCSWDG